MEPGREAETIAIGVREAPQDNVPIASKARTGFLSHTAAEDEGRFLPGTLLAGRYRLIGLLGRGGMGEVYRATDLMLGQSVALKFLPESAAANPMLLERFHGEVRVSRQVSHPNVCRVYDIGEADGMPFISMEYVDGEDLATLLTRIGRLPSAKALEAARQICGGLAAAHSRGVIHRDLKPQNIMMNRRGEVMLMDFGLAALSESVCGAEARHGTPAYMSPEQLKGADVTARSDIYALGLVLYELFTGKRAYEAANIQELIARQEEQQLTSMTSLAAETDPAVERVIRRCLDPEPLRRPATALQVSAALPGGDPLAAALAAGETPSPDVVAAAGSAEGLKPKAALIYLTVILACVFAMPFINQELSGFYSSGLEFSPAVLSHKAREIAASLGHPDRPADRILWLNQRKDLLRYLSGLNDASRRHEWLRAEAPVLARYREAASQMYASPSGQVTSEDPAPIQPGMLDLEMDGHARLRSLSAMPRALDSGVAAEVLAANVFRSAGLDIAAFTETSPITVPRTPTDRLQAWKGPHPTIPKTELTVEAGWWRGRLTHFRVFAPWAGQTGTGGGKTAARIRGVATLLILCGGIVVVLALARKNWKQNRGDRKGALRIAIFIFICTLVNWVGTAHIAPNDAALFQFFGALQEALYTAAVFWLLYLALEPAVRLRWPHSIVTWSRLLAGRWKDPDVAAHVLIGAAAGSVMLVAAYIPDVWLESGHGYGTAGGLYLLLGTPEWTAAVASRLREATNFGMLVFFVLFCARTALRRDWIAAIVTGLIFGMLQSDVASAMNPGATYVLYSVLYGAMAAVLLRLGLLAAVSGILFLNLLNAITLGADWTAWNAPTGFATIAFTLAIAAIAFRYALAGRGLFGDSMTGASG